MNNLSLSSTSEAASFLPGVSPEVKFVGQDGTTVLIPSDTPWLFLANQFVAGAREQGKTFPTNLLFAVFLPDQDLSENPQPVPLTQQIWKSENIPGIVSVIVNDSNQNQLGQALGQAGFERPPLPPPPRPLSPQNFSNLGLGSSGPSIGGQSLQQQMQTQFQLFQRLEQQYRDSLPPPVFSPRAHPKLNFHRRMEPLPSSPTIFLPADAPLVTYRNIGNLGWLNRVVELEAHNTALGPLIRSGPIIAYLKQLQAIASETLTRSSIYSRLIDPFDFVSFPSPLTTPDDELSPLEAPRNVEIVAPEQKETLREMERRIYGPLDTFAIATLAKDKLYLQNYLRNAVTFGNYLNVPGAPEVDWLASIRLLLATRSLVAFRPYLTDPEDIGQWCRAVNLLRVYVDKQKLENMDPQYLAYLDKLVLPSDLAPGGQGEGKEEKAPNGGGGHSGSAYDNMQCFDRLNSPQQFAAAPRPAPQPQPQPPQPSSFPRFQFPRPQPSVPAPVPVPAFVPQPQFQAPAPAPRPRVQEPVWLLPDFAPAQPPQAVFGSGIVYNQSLYTN